MKVQESIFCDALILGSGGAGLSMAIKLREAGVQNVIVLSKTNQMGSHTAAAKGGINAVLPTTKNDDVEWHIFDTLKSGAGLCDPENVAYMCRTAAAEIAWLEGLGVNFDKLPSGLIAQRKYGGQRLNFGKGDFAERSCFVADKTGEELMLKLTARARACGVKFANFHFSFKLVVQNGDVAGACVLDLATGKTVFFGAKVCVLATGGFSQIYKTNSSSNLLTGDGTGMALEAGAVAEDLEMVQFHPTGLAGKGILISEAVRAEGGYLLNSAGERFMQKYEPDFMELASRDKIARAIFYEKLEGRDCFLSLRHLSPEVVKKRLAGTVETAKFFGRIDVFKEDIPIFPTAHYNMGGVLVEGDYRVAGFGNLFAIGECASARIHGANRLGCNSLLELFTSSSRALEGVLECAKKRVAFKPDLNLNVDLDFGTRDIAFEELLEMKARMQDIMEAKCGVLRDGTRLAEGLAQTEALQAELRACKPRGLDSLCFSNEFVAFMELRTMLALGALTLKSALMRRESRGAHLRLDFPDAKPLALHTHLKLKNAY